MLALEILSTGIYFNLNKVCDFMFKSQQIDRIIRLVSEKDYPLIVGVDGLAGAGKSTLANQLVSCLPGSTCVNIDDFYRPIHLDQLTKLETDDLIEKFFDWKRLEDCLLIPASNNMRAVYYKHDWESDELSDRIEVSPTDVLIVEGVFAFLPTLRALYQLKIYVDTPKPQRISRIASRKYPNLNWMDAWILAEERYLNKFDPQSHADVVVHGSM